MNMSLVTSKELLQHAKQNGYAVPAFNANSLEMIPALVHAAEAERSPLILQIGTRFLNYFSPALIGSVAKYCAEQAAVPVCIHLDHGCSLEQAEQCLKAGFTSIMYDGSALPHEENIRRTAEIVRLSESYGIPVEGEIGRVLMAEDVKDLSALNDLTAPEDAAAFVERTGISSVAVAIGNVHHMRKKNAQIHFDLIRDLKEAVPVPLVIHGSSGISDDDVAKAVACGISKVNVATEFNIAFINHAAAYGNAHPDESFPMEVLRRGMDAVTDLARSRIHVVGADGRAADNGRMKHV